MVREAASPTLEIYEIETMGNHFSVVSKERVSLTGFEAFCQNNPGLRVEREPDGKLTVMPPVHSDSGSFESNPVTDLNLYVRRTGNGRAFGPSAGFELPDGSVRAADAAWVSIARWEKLTASQRQSFAPIVPDFVVEVRSRSDRAADLHKKMAETWMAQGVRLGWLIDPHDQKVWIYRENAPVELIEDFDLVLSGEAVVPGFEFELKWMKG